MANSLINMAEVNKASDRDIISVMLSLSNTLSGRLLNHPDFDIDQVMNGFLVDKSFQNPDNIKAPMLVNGVIFGVQSMPSSKDKNGNYTDGKTVRVTIKLPGEKVKWAWDESLPSFIDSSITSLGNLRAVAIHQVIPGTIVTFHHYTTKNGTYRRDALYSGEITYDRDQNLVWNKLPLEDSEIQLPEREDI